MHSKQNLKDEFTLLSADKLLIEVKNAKQPSTFSSFSDTFKLILSLTKPVKSSEVKNI